LHLSFFGWSWHPYDALLMQPISIVIPTLNEERYLPILLESLFRCPHPQMEIVICDCRSDDKTLDVVEYYKKRTPDHIVIKSVISNQRNVSQQRNLGAQHATHNVMIFLDADVCIPFPTRIKELVDLFLDEKLAVASCRFLPLDRDPRALLYYTTLYGFHKLMEKRSPYAMGACIVTTRKIFEACRGFDPSIKVNEDANFCKKASEFGPFKVLPVVLQVSTRRFRKYGYFRMGFQYFRMFMYRTFFGETRDDKIPYEWGKYES
jgi:glycosyltransferase involved in cell wall biosynthesis